MIDLKSRLIVVGCCAVLGACQTQNPSTKAPAPAASSGEAEKTRQFVEGFNAWRAEQDRQKADLAHQQAEASEKSRAAMANLGRGARICSNPGAWTYQYVAGLEERQNDRILVRISGTTNGSIEYGEPRPGDIIWSDVGIWSPC